MKIRRSTNNTFMHYIFLIGPGKLRIYNGITPVTLEGKDKATCIEREQFPELNLYVNEAVGTFCNGTLHGTAKLTLEDNRVVIANFSNGELKGASKFKVNI